MPFHVWLSGSCPEIGPILIKQKELEHSELTSGDGGGRVRTYISMNRQVDEQTE